MSALRLSAGTTLRAALFAVFLLAAAGCFRTGYDLAASRQAELPAVPIWVGDEFRSDEEQIPDPANRQARRILGAWSTNRLESFDALYLKLGKSVPIHAVVYEASRMGVYPEDVEQGIRERLRGQKDAERWVADFRAGTTEAMRHFRAGG